MPTTIKRLLSRNVYGYGGVITSRGLAACLRPDGRSPGRGCGERGEEGGWGEGGSLTLHPALYTLRARPPGRLLRQLVQAGPRFIVIYNEPCLVKLIFTRDTGDPSTAKVNFIYAQRSRCKWSAIKPAGDNVDFEKLANGPLAPSCSTIDAANPPDPHCCSIISVQRRVREEGDELLYTVRSLVMVRNQLPVKCL